jgi:methionyl-tRNA formyltransferase
MNVLYLGSKDKELPSGLYDCIISYGYRYKIPQEAINAVNGKAINLHISYLPWNRGANPNYWSWYDNTPKGVTIHYIDEGFDNGDIILQKEIALSNKMTLRESYAILQDEIQILFVENWHQIFDLPRKKQSGKGTSHTKSQVLTAAVNGWDTPACYIEKVGEVDRIYAGRTYIPD